MADLRALIEADPFAAHRELFRDYHENKACRAHEAFVADFWSDEKLLVQIGFRGFGKSTLVEEAVAIGAYRRWYRSCLFIGPSEIRAAEHLITVTRALRMNEELALAFPGVAVFQPGGADTQTYLELTANASIVAMGRGQNIRGLKKGNARPDLVIVDDFEDEDNVLTPDGRRAMLLWFLRALRRACHPQARYRVLCTIMHPECVPLQLVKTAGWQCRRYPALYYNSEGEETSTWPDRFPLALLERDRREAAVLGDLAGWELEMMCDETAAGTMGDFKTEHFRVEPVVRAWHAVYAMIDPARTVGRNSATTGWAVWSWVANRLIVWESGAKQLLPDEIVDLAFHIYKEYAPVEVGIEEDGLNEWLLQPIRHRMVRENTIPIRGVRAPRGKIDFIRGLQPFFAAGEVIMAREMPDLREQLLGFPTGRIDAPNALAYALQLRPGRLIYENWNANANIAAVEPVWNRPLYLAANASRSMVSLAMVQLLDGGRTVVVADWLAEGDPGESLEGILREASMMAGRNLVLTAAAHPHFEDFGNVGLVQTARRLGCECRQAGSPAQGRDFIRKEIGTIGREGPNLVVAPAARWTLNAFAGGYSRPLRHGQLASEPAENHYRMLMEGLEAMAGLLAWGLGRDEDDDETGNWAFDSEGRRYRSSLPERMRQHLRLSH